MIRASIAFLRKNLIPASFIESLKIRFRNFNTNPPILIYQMGKVGSTTILKSLKNAQIQNPVYHIHFLSSNGIRNAERYFKTLKGKKIPQHIKRSKLLHKKIVKNSKIHLKIITLVREPVIREISDFFENVDRYYPELIDERGKLDTDLTMQLLIKELSNFDESKDYTSTWFDNEIKPTFNIDVYAYPFNHRKGFSIIRNKNVELLILRLEDLDKNFNIALQSFFNLNQPIIMTQSNISREKVHSDTYNYVLNHIKIQRPLCETIYSSKYASHFYNEDMKRDYIRKWCSE